RRAPLARLARGRGPGSGFALREPEAPRALRHDLLPRGGELHHVGIFLGLLHRAPSRERAYARVRAGRLLHAGDPPYAGGGAAGRRLAGRPLGAGRDSLELARLCAGGGSHGMARRLRGETRSRTRDGPSLREKWRLNRVLPSWYSPHPCPHRATMASLTAT